MLTLLACAALFFGSPAQAVENPFQGWLEFDVVAGDQRQLRISNATIGPTVRSETLSRPEFVLYLEAPGTDQRIVLTGFKDLDQRNAVLALIRGVRGAAPSQLAYRGYADWLSREIRIPFKQIELWVAGKQGSLEAMATKYAGYRPSASEEIRTTYVLRETYGERAVDRPLLTWMDDAIALIEEEARQLQGMRAEWPAELAFVEARTSADGRKSLKQLLAKLRGMISTFRTQLAQAALQYRYNQEARLKGQRIPDVPELEPMQLDRLTQRLNAIFASPERFQVTLGEWQGERFVPSGRMAPIFQPFVRKSIEQLTQLALSDPLDEVWTYVWVAERDLESADLLKKRRALGCGILLNGTGKSDPSTWEQ